MEVKLSEWERIVLDELTRAAAEHRICPTYLDLNEAIGAESSSTSPSIVARLERNRDYWLEEAAQHVSPAEQLFARGEAGTWEFVAEQLRREPTA